MVKKIVFLLILSLSIAGVKAQTINSVKMADVVKRFSQKNDTIYVVNFWATFCKPCIEEIPYFIKVTDRYKDKKVKLLLVSLDLPAYYPARIAAFAKKNNYTPEIQWLKETNADVFCPMIDSQWSGAIPATIMVNAKTGKKIFFEEEIKEAKFEEKLLSIMNE